MGFDTRKMRGRPVTSDEAAKSVQRLINSHFHNKDSARCSIPVRADDDDIVASDYVLDSSEQIATLERQLSDLRAALEGKEHKPNQPKIICLCGSTRFIENFAVLTWELERTGAIVLGCTLLPQWYCDVPSHFGEKTGTKEQCDELHKRKIDLADEILVINIGGYIGDSTRSEIEYATANGKPVRYVEPLPPAPINAPLAAPRGSK